jgi:predicted  nucleic acid-binding Zn-ribbon protein
MIRHSSDYSPVPENTTNEEFERLHRRRQELKEQSERIEQKLEQLQTELKKVTGRIILPEEPPKGKPPGK